MDFKSTTSKARVDGRTVTGIFAVLGNRDSVGDRVMPGAFTKTFSEGRRRARHLWNHDGFAPPIARIVDLYEIGKSDLPQDVLEFAPDAIGAAIVVREYLDTPRANEVLEGIKAGAIEEMSFAFRVPANKAEAKQEDINGEKVLTRFVREVQLFDTSDVNWGANNATLAVRSLPAETIALGLKSLLDEYKAGRRNSANDAGLIQSIHDLAVDLEAVCAGEKAAPAEEIPEQKLIEVLDFDDLRTRLALLEIANLELAM
jgi:uncharacterized protein